MTCLILVNKSCFLVLHVPAGVFATENQKECISFIENEDALPHQRLIIV